MYLPTITKATNVSNYALGSYLVAVLTDCESQGLIEYKHVLMVYVVGEDKKLQPVMAVAAEVGTMLKQIQPNSYFFGVFDGNGHGNYGMSEEWGDLDKFKKRGLEVIAEKLGVKQPPQLITRLN